MSTDANHAWVVDLQVKQQPKYKYSNALLTKVLHLVKWHLVGAELQLAVDRSHCN